MEKFFVSYTTENEPHGSFGCMAEDDDHAEEQCRNAYPNCTIKDVTALSDTPYDEEIEIMKRKNSFYVAL
jgi:hypothetical protein